MSSPAGLREPLFRDVLEEALTGSPRNAEDLATANASPIPKNELLIYGSFAFLADFAAALVKLLGTIAVITAAALHQLNHSRTSSTQEVQLFLGDHLTTKKVLACIAHPQLNTTRKFSALRAGSIARA